MTTAVEHKAVLNSVAILERSNFDVTVLPVDRSGRVDPLAVADALTDRTTLVSVMAANNEVGTLQPIAEIGEIVRGHPARLHVDAVQFAAHAPIDVNAWQADLVSLSAHKLGGPRASARCSSAAGPTCCRSSRRLAGASATRRNRERRRDRVRRCLRDRGRRDAGRGGSASRAQRATRSRAAVGGWREPHRPSERLANNVSVVIEGVEGGDLVAALDLDGVEVSTGSACTSGSTEPSHVLLAMGIEPELAHGSIRITTGPETTAAVDRAMEVLHAVLPRLRASREMVASA